MSHAYLYTSIDAWKASIVLVRALEPEAYDARSKANSSQSLHHKEAIGFWSWHTSPWQVGHSHILSMHCPVSCGPLIIVPNHGSLPLSGLWGPCSPCADRSRHKVAANKDISDAFRIIKSSIRMRLMDWPIRLKLIWFVEISVNILFQETPRSSRPPSRQYCVH